MFTRSISRTIRTSLALTGFGLLLGAAFAGCTSSEDKPPAITQQLQLIAFSDCDGLEEYIEDTAVELMRSQMRGDRWFWRGGPEFDAGAVPSADAGNQAGPDAYTTTNVQVAGVDEADFVKNNGTNIFVISANKLYITKSWPAAELDVVATVDLEGYPYQMFFDDDRDQIAVLGTVFAPYAAVPANTSVDCLAYGWCGEWAAATKVTVIDVSDPATPSVTDEQYFPGWLQNSRRVEGSIRLVLNDQFRWPDGLQWWPDYEEDLYDNELLLQARLEDLADENEPIIRARTLSDWLPNGLRRLPDGTLIDVPYDCRDFHRVNAPVTLGFTTVATINLDEPDQMPGRTSIIADTSEVYASLESLYLATRHWWWWPEPGQVDHTYLFKFDITDPDEAIFAAAGGAPGHILNQFSMDEHNGYLRIATTINRRVVEPDNPWGRVETTNQVSVLEERSGLLEVIGSTPEIAKGETIQSARFLGDKGFVVTFEQIDPLFTLDLSDPTDPSIIGELKIPGFSSYLHPLDANHLLAIGTYLPEPDPNGQVDWQQRSMKLSIFDVTDFANPVEQFSAVVGTAYGWSEAAWEHKAFNYFPERGLLAIPFSDYQPSAENYWDSFVSDLRVFSISTETGITARGSIDMADIYQTYAYRDWTWSYSPWIRRSVMADDFVYAISDAGIRVANVMSLSTPIATAEFDPVVNLP